MHAVFLDSLGQRCVVVLMRILPAHVYLTCYYRAARNADAV